MSFYSTYILAKNINHCQMWLKMWFSYYQVNNPAIEMNNYQIRKQALHARLSHSTICNRITSTKKTPLTSTKSTKVVCMFVARLDVCVNEERLEVCVCVDKIAWIWACLSYYIFLFSRYLCMHIYMYVRQHH